MKTKRNPLTKALSVLMTAVMLFTMLAVGIIVPDAKIEASAASYTANSYDSLKTAINSANSAGGTSTITLNGNISTSSSLAALPTITGNVILDFNGYSIFFSYEGSGSGANSSYQLPSENAGSNHNGAYVLTKAMLNVGTTGSLQLVNSSSLDAMFKVKTRFACTNNATYAIQTSASAIYSKGKVIVGSKNDTSKNNFTVFAQALSVTDNKDGYKARTSYANAYAITIDDATNGVLQMYGGTVNTAATCRGNNDGNLEARCFSININACYSAEIYGGNINVVGDDECGHRNSSSLYNTSGGTSFYAAIRTCSSNLYIFNTSSSVYAYGGADTKSSTIRIYNILTNDTAIPHIYGGTFTNTAGKSDSDSCTLVVATLAGQTEGQGKFQLGINGTIDPGTAYVSSDYNRTYTGNGNKGANYNISAYFFSKIYFGDAYTENGIYPWSFNTFRNYLAGHTSTNDAYFSYSSTHIGDGSTQTVDNQYLYRRNGYTQNGWYGSYNVGNETNDSFNCQNSGTLFLYPKWNINTYTIAYTLNDETGNNRASNQTGAPTTYQITSTSSLPLPTRAGYYFKGWLLDSKSVPATDTQDPWMQGSTYSPLWNGSAYTAAKSLNGMNGNISLKATWEVIPYTATFNFDNIPAGQSGTAEISTSDYDVNSTFNFPNSASKPYYTFNNLWKVTTADGSFAAGNTYGAGNTSANASYGNVTFTAQYTPITYTVTFDPNSGGAITPNYETTDANKYQYNYESTATLPATTRTGYTFAGWKVQGTEVVDNIWDPATSYPAGTSLNHMHGNVTLVAQWESVASTVTLNLGTGVNIQGNTSLPYAYASSLVLNNPTRTGYTFKGWKVTQIPNNYTTADPAANRWVLNREYLLGNEQNVTLPANMLGDVTLSPIWQANSYDLTYNTNGGTAVTGRSFTIEDTVTLGTTTRNGYTFTNWLVTAGDSSNNWTESTLTGTTFSGKYGHVTLTAQWEQKTYTATLNVNGGDTLSDDTLDYKIENRTLLPEPTRTGYTFTGWKLTSCDTQSDWATYTGRPEDDIYTDALPYGHYGNLTLTAQWTHKAYMMTINTNGTNGDDRTYYYDSDPFTLGSSELAGYTFNNWKVTAASGNWTQGTTLSATTPISAKYGDVTLEAQFTPNNYTITYLDENGDQFGDAQTYTIEDTVTLRSFTTDGYDFTGWKVTAAAGSWTTDSVLEAGDLSANMYYGNVTLAPELTVKEYKLTFDSNGGSPFPAKLYTIETADYTLPEPTKTGYDFSGWKVTAAAGSWTENALFPAGTAVTGKFGSATLTAQWTAKKYAITYIVGNTTLYPSGITKQGTFNETAPDLTDAEKAKPSDAQYDYTFDHWTPALSTVTGEATYTAVYTNTLRSYDITWMIPDDVGGTLTNYTSSVTPSVNYGTVPVYNDGVNPVLPSDSPEEYSWRFAGWATTAGGTVLENLPTVTGTAAYYAVFTKVLAPEEVNWVINGTVNTELWGIGETPVWQHETPSKPDEGGYKFIFSGWDNEIVPVVQGNTYTYTALFTSELQTYNYSLDVNGGETDAALTGTYKMGDTVSFPAPAKTGYTFAGWLIDSASGTWAADTLVNAGDYVTNTLWGEISFTAQWTRVTYHINYNKASTLDTVPAAAEYTIESTDTLGTATRTGYTLAGWIVSTGSGNWTQGQTLAADYALNGNYGDITLTPVWQVNSYTIHWISGGAEQTTEVEYGGAIIAIPPSSRMGYTADWDNVVPSSMPANDLTFTAVYTPVEYYVRVNVNGGSAVENFYYTINGDKTLPTPTRDGATFAGWKVTAAAGNWSKNQIIDGGTSLNGKYGNVSLTAQWTMRTCTVIWNAGDKVKETVWYYGATPSFDGTPYKSSDEYNSYVFTGWDKEIVPVTEDTVTYTAQFAATERIYTVTWIIGATSYTEEYRYGETPVYSGSTPVRESTTEYDFTFSGWAPAIESVTKDVSYVAQFNVFTKVLGLSLNASAKFLEIADSDTLEATIYPANATVRDLTWTSLNSDVATIDAAGKITAVNPGVALIKVSSKDEKFNSFCVVTVNPKISSSITLTAGNISTTQLPGTTIKLTASITNEASNTEIKWSSSNTRVATVDQTGLVTFVNPGDATITVTAADGYATASIAVKTAANEEEAEAAAKEYYITFAGAGSKFIILCDDGAESIPYRELTIKCVEGGEIVFRIDNTQFTALVNGVSYKPEADGYYHITNITKNLAIVDEIIPIGIDVIDPDKDENNAPSFLQRLQAFLRKIVEFFRNLFKR